MICYIRSENENENTALSMTNNNDFSVRSIKIKSLLVEIGARSLAGSVGSIIGIILQNILNLGEMIAKLIDDHLDAKRHSGYIEV